MVGRSAATAGTIKSAAAPAVANALPDILRFFGVAGNAPNGVPCTVLYAFKLGGLVFLLAVLYTVAVSREYPPENLEEFRRKKSQPVGLQVQPAFCSGRALPARRWGRRAGPLSSST